MFQHRAKVFQIPLKVTSTYSDYMNESIEDCEEYFDDICCSMEKENNERGMDDAILQKGEAHSDFKGVNNKNLERDLKFPIRCTLQFYKVTDSASIPEAVFQDMNTKIKEVYTKGINQGSLVTDGFTGRSTEWTDK